MSLRNQSKHRYELQVLFYKGTIYPSLKSFQANALFSHQSSSFEGARKLWKWRRRGCGWVNVVAISAEAMASRRAVCSVKGNPKRVTTRCLFSERAELIQSQQPWLHGDKEPQWRPHGGIPIHVLPSTVIPVYYYFLSLSASFFSHPLSVSCFVEDSAENGFPLLRSLISCRNPQLLFFPPTLCVCVECVPSPAVYLDRNSREECSKLTTEPTTRFSLFAAVNKRDIRLAGISL